MRKDGGLCFSFDMDRVFVFIYLAEMDGIFTAFRGVVCMYVSPIHLYKEVRNFIRTRT